MEEVATEDEEHTEEKTMKEVWTGEVPLSTEETLEELSMEEVLTGEDPEEELS